MNSASSPTISIAITVYNRQDYLAQAIESVLAQTRSDFELLIWDDESTDDSLAIAHHYAQRDARVRVIAGKHQGCAGSMRSAVAQTTGVYVGWVDSDDLLAATALEETVAILEQAPQVGMVYTQYTVIDQAGNDCGRGQRYHIAYSPQQLLVDFMTFHFRLMRRSLYDRVGGIDSSFVMAEDYDLCLKLSEVTEIRHLPRSLYFYRRHGANITNRQLEMLHWMEQAIRAALNRRKLTERYQLDIQVVSYVALLPKVREPELLAPLPIVQSQRSHPLVSVIIPYLTPTARIEACLQRCFQQIDVDLEILGRCRIEV